MSYDLWFDPNEVDRDLAVECWISHGPRSGDPVFDPRPGDVLLASDDEDEPFHAHVVRRDGNRVWLQLHPASQEGAVVS